MVLVKRLTKIRTKQNQTELFIEGDNQNRSIDSRRLGWVSNDYLIGKVKFVWFSFAEGGRLFLNTSP
jgi:type IV secretory pathway protease TraF